MYCKQCGLNLPDGATYCPQCGNRVANTNTASTKVTVETFGGTQFAVNNTPQPATGVFNRDYYSNPRNPDAEPPRPPVTVKKALQNMLSTWTFRGRASRQEFWKALVAILLIVIPLAIALGIFMDNHPIAEILIYAIFIFAFLCAIPQLCLTVRRLHDTGKSGWYYFITLIPWVGSIILLYFMLKPSLNTPENEWHTDTKTSPTPEKTQQF
jgi:uncharacterized membrane protein YhaH (DUF805 family)